MAFLTQLACWLVLALSAYIVHAQGPNTQARYHPNLRTQSSNGTWFIIPVSRSKVAKVIGKYKLGPVPRNDKDLFPQGFPKSKHPVVVNSIYGNDIRHGNLEIDHLLSSAVFVPYVDVRGDGTPFQYPAAQFIGGADKQDLMAIIPVIVGSANSSPIKFAKFYPNDAAYSQIGPNSFSSQVKKVTVPNPISGPGIVPSAVDLTFRHDSEHPRYTAKAFHAMINQPTVLVSAPGKCQRNPIYFNESFANPIFERGQVTLYSGAIPASLAGVYKGVTGYSGNGELVGYNPYNCQTGK